MIAQRIAADDVLTAAVSAQASSDEAARAAIQADVDQNEADADAAIAAEEARVDALIASGMWLYVDQAAFPLQLITTVVSSTAIPMGRCSMPTVACGISCQRSRPANCNRLNRQ